jgi:demethylspheroidene O-methyltransferase
MTGAPERRWGDLWRARRNRLFADPRFQRWAADFPLTRPVAHARTQGLFDLVAGFVYAQTLSACVRLRLLERLRDGPMTGTELMRALDLPRDGLRRLTGAAQALGLVEAAGPDRFALGAQGAALLGAAGLMEMIAHHDRLYGDLADSVGLLRRGRGELAAYWPYATSETPGAVGREDVAAYSALMAATQPAVAADLLDAYPMRDHRVLMDVGGGEGAFLQAAAARAPQLRLRLFDLPAVGERARARLGAAGLLDRVEILGGDFLADPLPEGADLISLVRILHDHDDAGVDRLLRAARAALPAHGALLIGEPMSGGARPDRVSDVYFAFYLLAMGRGRARSPQELTARLKAAGFSRVRTLRTRTPALLRALIARP